METGEVMVIKELLQFDEDTQKTFLKEVCGSCRFIDFQTAQSVWDDFLHVRCLTVGQSDEMP